MVSRNGVMRHARVGDGAPGVTIKLVCRRLISLGREQATDPQGAVPEASNKPE